jgi:chromatin assembly factor 1 subunit A
LTDKEKEEKRLEKEAKEKAKAELKAQREEEKRKKDEEKRKKNEEKEEKRRAKEQEQQQKEEEKLKKERVRLVRFLSCAYANSAQSQMRLGAFFAKQKTDTNSSNAALVDSKQNIATNPLSSLSGTSTGDANIGSVSPQKAIKQSAKTDYERYFLPFQPPSYAIVAPYNLFMEDPKRKSEAASRLEQRIAREDASTEPVTMADIKAKIGPRRRGLDTPSIVEIVNRINDSSDNSVDLTQEGSTQDPLKLLKRVPMKYLHFPEDVRPPYYGTYTKAYTPREAAKLARNPFTRSLKEADYDYDSEAEWEEPEEGEDLNSDGEEDLDEDGDDDMDGFLDDEEDAQVKRRLISSDLEPISTGLCWEDPDRVSRLNDGSGAISTEFKDFRFGCLLGKFSTPSLRRSLTSTRITTPVHRSVFDSLLGPTAYGP